MENIEIKIDFIPKKEDILSLYEDVGWTAYTEDLESLYEGIKSSLRVWTLWDGEILVGLGRVVGDGQTIIYVQDILILLAYQGRGLGSKILDEIIDTYKDVQKIILSTDDDESLKDFYKSKGFRQVGDYGCVSFMRLI